MAMPGLPNYDQSRGSNTNWQNLSLSSPQGKASDYWAANPFNDQGLGNYAKTTGQQANNFLTMTPNPLTSNSLINPANWNPQSFSSFGFGYPSITNPGTRQQLGMWNNYLNSNTRNTLEGGAAQLAGAGIASGRGGYGVAGGSVGPEASIMQGINKTVAGQSRQNTSDAMNYMFQAAQGNQALLSALMSAFGNMYGAQLSTGAKLSSNQLSAEEAAMQGQQAYNTAAGGAYASDVNRYNDWQGSVADRMRQMHQANTTDMRQRNNYDVQQGALGQLENNVSQGAGVLGPWAYGAGMAPIWQQQAGVTPGSYAAGGNSGVIRRNSQSIQPMSNYDPRWGLGA